MKDDNAEIAIMEQQIGELTDQISRFHDEANQLDQDLEENQSEKNVKYRDLRKREEAMDQVKIFPYTSLMTDSSFIMTHWGRMYFLKSDFKILFQL